jgi:hypothetical protein
MCNNCETDIVSAWVHVVRTGHDSNGMKEILPGSTNWSMVTRLMLIADLVHGMLIY